MIKDRCPLKNKISNVILIGYISLNLIVLILLIPPSSIQLKIISILVTVIALVFRILIIFVFWNTVMIKYIKKDNKINIIQLIVALLLIMLAFFPIGLMHNGFIETFIVISIVIIIRKEYLLFKRTL